MALKTYTAADGTVFELDDEVSLIGKRPKTESPEAETPNFVPIQFHHTDERSLRGKPKERSGYGSGVDDPEWQKLWR
jgi:hypothetical protein